MGSVPGGLEELLRRAAQDPELKRALLEDGMQAASEAGIELTTEEAQLLKAAFPFTLEKVVDAIRRDAVSESGAGFLKQLVDPRKPPESRPLAKERAAPPMNQVSLGIRPEPSEILWGRLVLLTALVAAAVYGLWAWLAG